MNIVSNYLKSAQRVYKSRHGNVARSIHWGLCENHRIQKVKCGIKKLQEKLKRMKIVNS